MVLQGIEKRKWLYINVAINILVTAVLGGRMSAVISACMILFAYVYSGKIKLWKKLIIIVGLVVSAYILLNNLIDILYCKPKTSTIWNAISKCYFVDKSNKKQ